MLVFIVSISAVNAHDSDIGVFANQADYGTLKTDDVGNFTELNDEIGKIQTGGNLTLKKDYAYDFNDSDFSDGIRIYQDNIVIDGAGHTINGLGHVRIFNVVSNNVTLKNINFINGYSNKSGGAIFAVNNVNILNSTFINNSARSGGAVCFNGTTADVTVNGYFEDNRAERTGGALYFGGQSKNNTVSSEFYNNFAGQSGGAIFFYTLAEDNLFESVFRYNNANYGAGIFFYNKANNNRFNSDFRFNVAQSCGGAMFFHNTTNNDSFSGYFINNSALGKVDDVNGNGGAITFKDTSSNCVFVCDFINNTGVRNGGGVNYRQNSYNITFNSNFINNNAGNGGGVNFFESFENVVFNGQFIGNNASYGGAIAAISGIIANTLFIDNSAENGGAVYFDGDGEIINCEFNSNEIIGVNGDGGAVYFNGDGTIANCNFTDNKAVYYGGAVYFWGDAKIENSIFNANNAQNGGSVYVHGDGEVNNCNFTDNHARTGGAIEFWASATVENSAFTDNVGTFSGGAIYCSDDLKVNDSIFTNNSAEGYAGGAIYIYGLGEINCCNFTNNVASRKGGAIFFNSEGIVTNSIIANTKSDEGALYFRTTGTIEESAFIKNDARDGGAILTYGNLTIVSSTFDGNIATLGTNHISLKENATLNLTDMDPKSLEPFYVGDLTIINATNVVYGENVIITVYATDENYIPFNNGTVSCTIGGTAYSANVENGLAVLVIPKLNAGNYAVNLTYSGNQYVAISQALFNVSKQNAVIVAANKAYIINYGGKYSIVLKDIEGNVLSGKTVTFTLGGKFIKSATTNVNGVASITLAANVLKSLKAGKKNLLIKFDDSNYNKVSKTVKITINKEKTKIVAKNQKFKRTVKVKKYVVALKNSKAKPLKKVWTTLKVNGKTYKAKTNSKGKATFKITKLTKKGKFGAIVKFAGNNYYKATSKKVKITVK